MAEDRSSNTSFIDATRGGTLLEGELRLKERKNAKREADPDATEKKAQPTEFRDVYDGEWFVDAEEDEELMDTLLQKHGFGRSKTDSILLCPGCFSTLCNICQQHDIYHDQYRAMIVTPSVRVSKASPKIEKDENGVCFEYWTVLCRGCEVEVGVYDPLEEMCPYPLQGEEIREYPPHPKARRALLSRPRIGGLCHCLWPTYYTDIDSSCNFSRDTSPF